MQHVRVEVEVETDAVSQEVDDIARAYADRTQDVAVAVAAVLGEDVVHHLLGCVLDPEFALEACPGGLDEAAAQLRVAPSANALLEQEHLAPELHRPKRGRHPGTAGANDHDSRSHVELDHGEALEENLSRYGQFRESALHEHEAPEPLYGPFPPRRGLPVILVKPGRCVLRYRRALSMAFRTAGVTGPPLSRWSFAIAKAAASLE